VTYHSFKNLPLHTFIGVVESTKAASTKETALVVHGVSTSKAKTQVQFVCCRSSGAEN
jgi:hypothetical protein